MNALGLALSSLLLLSVAPAPPDARALGREWTAQFLRGEIEPLWSLMTDDMQKLFVDQDGLRTFQRRVAAAGGETALIGEQVEAGPDGMQSYRRTVRLAYAPQVFVFAWAIDRAGRIAGLLVKPAENAASAKPTEAASPYLNRATMAALRLPFDGDWTVAWGGRTLADNDHAAAVDQRFAYDFVVVRKGTTHSGRGRKSDDYYAFGLPILAPAAGVVIAAHDGEDDVDPGVERTEKPFGNHVILDLESGEFAFLAHLRRGSVRVHAGERLAAGDRVGTCGNSGHTSEPHLHFHLQDTAEPFAGRGLPAQFEHYLADGVLVARGEPRHGQVVRATGAPR